MSDTDYVWCKVEALVEGKTNKAFLVNVDGKPKWIAYSQTLNVDVAGQGTMDLRTFRQYIQRKQRVFVEYVEVAEWSNDRALDLEVIEQGDRVVSRQAKGLNEEEGEEDDELVTGSFSFSQLKEEGQE